MSHVVAVGGCPRSRLSLRVCTRSYDTTGIRYNRFDCSRPVRFCLRLFPLRLPALLFLHMAWNYRRPRSRLVYLWPQCQSSTPAKRTGHAGSRARGSHGITENRRTANEAWCVRYTYAYRFMKSIPHPRRCILRRKNVDDAGFCVSTLSTVRNRGPERLSASARCAPTGSATCTVVHECLDFSIFISCSMSS